MKHIKKPIIYISGHMSKFATLRGRKKFNFDNFNGWAKYWRSCGYEVMNPAEHNTDTSKDWTWYIIEDLKWIRRKKPDFIFSLRDWQTSAGACIERLAVIKNGGTPYNEEDFV